MITAEQVMNILYNIDPANLDTVANELFYEYMNEASAIVEEIESGIDPQIATYQVLDDYFDECYNVDLATKVSKEIKKVLDK